jgi:hypothetical protein
MKDTGGKGVRRLKENSIIRVLAVGEFNENSITGIEKPF